jgi:hypothetical protein
LAKVAAAWSPSLITLRSSRFLGTVKVALDPISARAARPATMAPINLGPVLAIQLQVIFYPGRVRGP